MNLSKRLFVTAGYIPPGMVAADIGSDHVQLPLYLIRSGRCPKVIASELSEKPYQQACFCVRLHGLQNRIDVRQGDGLRVLFPGEAEVAVIAGLGGETIIRMLLAAPGVLDCLKRLILQPMADAGVLRLWLVDNGWKLIDEALVEGKGGRLYEVIIAEQGEETTRDRLSVEIGPRLVEKEDPLLYRYLENLKEEYQRILNRLGRSRNPAAREKAIVLTAKLERVRECLKYLNI